jgi:hypothetical protein
MTTTMQRSGVKVLRVQHTPKTGTIVLGVALPDKSARKIMKDDGHKLQWGKFIGDAGGWYFPRTRDRKASLPKIQRLVDDLVAAGYGVKVSIDDTQTRTPLEIEQDRAARAEARAQYYRNRATMLTTSKTEDAAEEAAPTVAKAEPEPARSTSKPTATRKPEPEPEVAELHDYPILSETPVVRRKRLGVITRKRNDWANSAEHSRKQLAQAKEGHSQIPFWANHVKERTADVAKLDAERAAIEASGVRFFKPEDIEVGGLVFKDNRWHQVLKINPKSVVVPHPMFGKHNVVIPRGELKERWTWDRVEDYLPPNHPDAEALYRKAKQK